MHDIKAGDFINVNLLGVGLGNELVTTVTSAYESVQRKTLWTITTSNRTMKLYQHQFQLSGGNASNTGTYGVEYWVVGQNE